MVSQKSVIANLIWRFLERCGAQAVTFVVSIILARLLEPEVYGTVALITVIITLLQVFIDSGFGTALIQKKDSDNIDFSTVFFFNIGMCLILYGALFFLAPLIATFYEIPSLTPVIRVLGITLIISGVKNVQQAYVSKHMLFKRFFFATIGSTIFSAAVGIGIAAAGGGVWALVFQSICNNLISAVILWFTVKWRPRFVFSFSRFKKLFSFGWKLLASSLIDTLFKEIRQLIIGKKYSTADLAYYNRGSQYPSMVINDVNASINSVLLPVLSDVQNDKERVRAMTRRAIKTSAFVIWPIMMGLAVCAEPIVCLLLTEKWLPCVPYLQIYCFVYALYPVHTANLNALKAMGKSGSYLSLEIVKKSINLVLLLVSMWHGVLAMAYSLLISSFLNSIINAFPNKKLLNYSWFAQIGDLLPTLLLTLAMGGAVYSINFIPMAASIKLLLQIPTGVIIYTLGAFLFRLESFRYVLDILLKFIRKKKGSNHE